MGAHSRSKGRRAEQQIVVLAKQYGLSAERCWSLAQSSNPADRVKDIRIGSDCYQVQITQDGFSRLYAELQGVRGFIFRRDRDGWLVTLRLADYLELLRGRS